LRKGGSRADRWSAAGLVRRRPAGGGAAATGGLVARLASTRVQNLHLTGETVADLSRIRLTG
jgi:hypothetical protein